MNRDPWRHRSENLRCMTCIWFVAKGASSLGRCRRHAPTLSGYPAVFMDDWCGDHKLDELCAESAQDRDKNTGLPSIAQQPLDRRAS